MPRIWLPPVLGLVLLVASRGEAQQVRQSCTITAVDAEQKQVTVRLGRGQEAKTGPTQVADDARITVAGKPAGLGSLPVPTEASVIYDRQLGALVRIEVNKPAQAFPEKPTPTAPSRPPSLALAPFDAAHATGHQAAWAKYLGVPVEVSNAIGMKFVLIPPGEFTMGTAETGNTWAAIASPRHPVRITRTFYLARTEVTQAEYQRVMGANPSDFSAQGRDREQVLGVDTTRLPVENVSWLQAEAFCAALAQMPDEQNRQRRYRLPTQAEWEHAARAGTASDYPAGDGPKNLGDHAWFNQGAERRPHEVGQKLPNAWGLHDVCGNVWEWCSDWRSDDYYQRSPLDDPPGPESGSQRVLRGGAWTSLYPGVRLWHYVSRDPAKGHNDTGFRVVLEVAVRGRDVVAKPSAPPPPAHAASVSDRKAPPPAVAPFDARQAAERQKAWAKYLGAPVEMSNSIGMRLVLIPPGEFTMGENATQLSRVIQDFQSKGLLPRRILDSESDPPHRVQLTRPFYLGMHEVTMGEKLKLDASRDKATAPAAGTPPEKAQTPATPVSWLDASDFCRRLSDLPAEQQGKRWYRLPTEAEWEYACRAGTTALWSFGDDPQAAEPYAWLARRADGAPRPVGQKKANPWGLHDMHGNVWEWCSDWFAEHYYLESPESDPSGPLVGLERIARGGAWNNPNPWESRSAGRLHRPPTHRMNAFGLRVVAEVPFSGFAPKVRPRAAVPTPSARAWGLPSIDVKKGVQATNDPVRGPWSVAPDATGWIALFDGSSLTAWREPAAEKWRVTEGELAWNPGGGDLWTKDAFGDFVFDFEFKCAQRTNSGVYLRGPIDGWHGLEVQILGTRKSGSPGKYDTGALYDCLAPTVSADKPLGQWNRMTITYRGSRLTVVLNDQQVVDADMDRWTEPNKNPDGTANKYSWAMKDLPRVGRIGLQDHRAPVWYRNLRIKPLGPADGPRPPRGGPQPG